MNLPIKTIAELLEAKIDGNSSLFINKISKIEEGEAGSISFLANQKYAQFISSTKASAVIVKENFTSEQQLSCTLLRVPDPYQAFSKLLAFVANEQYTPKKGIEPLSFTSEDASIGKDVYIGAFSYIGHRAVIEDNVQIYPNVYIGDDVIIGEGTTIFPHTIIYHQCEIGKNCILHGGVVIGSDGFGFAPTEDGQYIKVPQIGRVIVSDNVEIGSNTTIDRATIGATRILSGVKLDNLIQIAHNVEIGEHTVIAAQTGVSGSTKIGKACQIGGQVGIVGHLNVADQTMIGAQSGLSKSVKKPNTQWRGSPAQNYHKQLRSEAVFRQLDSLNKRIQDLERILADKKDKVEENVK